MATAIKTTNPSDNLYTSASVGGEFKAGVYSRVTVIDDTPEPLGRICSYGVPELKPDDGTNPNWPGYPEIYFLDDGILPVYYAYAGYDLQFETSPCTAETHYQIGYLDKDDVFHEFSNYAIYTDSNLTTLYNFGWNGPNVNWVNIDSHSKTATVYIKVNDTGYEGVYEGECYEADYL